MDQKDLILAALSAVPGSSFTPVQLQKMLFLIDRKMPHVIGGPKWSFYAWDYGPFDGQVYDVATELAESGMVVITKMRENFRFYSLTPMGQSSGQVILSRLDPSSRDYLAALSNWVRSLSFAQLVSAIYREFPEMRARSVFAETQ